jgi:GT2 family glycosyltransferase
MRVSVVMPCYRDARLVERSLPRILAGSRAELEVVLANNDSGQADELRTLVDTLGDPRVRLLELEHGAGFIRAVNDGIASTSGELVFLANSDLFVADDYLDELVRVFERHPRAACATGKILRFELDGDGETTVLDSTGHTIGRDRGAFDRGENEEDVGQYEREEEVFGVSAAALVARRKALESVKLKAGYLDETFHMYKEDVDLSWRFRLAGWECWYVPTAIAYHARTSRAPSTAAAHSSVRAFHENERRKPRHVRTNSMKNQWLMLVKNEDVSNLARDLPFVLGREVLVLGYNMLFAPRITAAALGHFVRSLPAAVASRREIKRRQTASPNEIRRWFAPRSQASAVARGTRQPG